jgi:hypothetical protein
MKYDGIQLYIVMMGFSYHYGMKHDESHPYMVIMWNKSQGKCNIMIVWDET